MLSSMKTDIITQPHTHLRPSRQRCALTLSFAFQLMSVALLMWHDSSEQTVQDSRQRELYWLCLYGTSCTLSYRGSSLWSL